MKQIKFGFYDSQGTYYDKVREIAYRKSDLMRLGKFVAQTDEETCKNMGIKYEPADGVLIYQAYDNPNVAYRIYKTFNEYNFNGYMDEIIIQNLQERKSGIKLTKFPTGVVTLDGKIIGQEIPYFPHDMTVEKFFKRYKNFLETDVYRQILNVLYEMYQNEIYYLDNHAKNFMIDPDYDSVKIDVIDFDYYFVKFSDIENNNLSQLIKNYCKMVNNLNLLKSRRRALEMPLVENFDDAYYEIDKMERKLTRK